MTYSKRELFDKDLQEFSNFFKVLSHPARLAILKHLAKVKVCITGDISEEIPLGRTTVNQHLKELKRLEIIQGHIDGIRTNYCLNPKKIRQLKLIMERFLNELDIDFYCNC